MHRCQVPAITLKNYQNDKMFFSLPYFRDWIDLMLLGNAFQSLGEQLEKIF